MLSVKDSTGRDISNESNNSAAINPFRYRGYYYDTESGFYYLQSRYYDPAISRFINADEYSSTGQGFLGYNMYAYCNNSPVNCSDPSGRMLCYDNLLYCGSCAYAPITPISVNSFGGGYAGASSVSSTSGYTGAATAACALALTAAMTSSQEKEEEATATAEDRKKPVIFPVDPLDFHPLGLVMVVRPGTGNGKLISWMDMPTKTEVFRWDENPKFSNGPHYHVNSTGHYKPGIDAVPEPQASIYFPFR